MKAMQNLIPSLSFPRQSFPVTRHRAPASRPWQSSDIRNGSFSGAKSGNGRLRARVELGDIAAMPSPLMGRTWITSPCKLLRLINLNNLRLAPPDFLFPRSAPILPAPFAKSDARSGHPLRQFQLEGSIPAQRAGGHKPGGQQQAKKRFSSSSRSSPRDIRASTQWPFADIVIYIIIIVTLRAATSVRQRFKRPIKTRGRQYCGQK